MKRLIIVGTALYVCLFRALPAFASEDGDWQLWNTESIEVKLTDHWKLKAEQEFRIGDNFSNLYYLHTDGGLSYKVTDGLFLGVNYRQIWEKTSGSKWTDENRPYFNGTVKWKWYGFDFKDRSRFEYRMREGKDDKWRYRNKLTASLPWEWTTFDIRPYVADEIFVDFHGEKLTRNRVYGGITAKLFKHLKTDIFYLWQTSRNIDKWTDYNVLGIKLKAVF